MISKDQQIISECHLDDNCTSGLLLKRRPVQYGVDIVTDLTAYGDKGLLKRLGVILTVSSGVSFVIVSVSARSSSVR